MISGNINEHGFAFPQNLLEEILVRGSRESVIYHPDSFGQKTARDGVSGFYQESGLSIDPAHILITPGTSLSYWYCFKLLADEGDEILCPCPAYPLFDYIAVLSGVKLISYPLMEKCNWEIDLDRLEASISNKTRALVLISPHNPTGHVASPEEISGLAEVAIRHDLAIISDEVFSEFLIQHRSLPRPIESAAPLVFTLNGFSKMFALPGMKFGWMTVTGDPDKVRQAVRSLELISDTFLPVNETVQACASDIFQLGHAVRFELGLRVRECWNLAGEILSGSRIFNYVRPEGGFYVTLRLEDLSEERATETLLQENGLLVHPGYFYDMDPDHLILSFVQTHEVIQNALQQLLGTLENLKGIS